MLPRAPKAGKRILLERIPPLSPRPSFSWKVTFRNLFRYKKRFVMTVIGIAGCTALLLTGLGLSDAINDIIDKQYGEIVHYNAVVTTEDDLPAASQQELDDLLGAGGAVESSTRVQSASMVASGPRQGRRSCVRGGARGPGRPWPTSCTVRTRVGHEPLSIGDDGVVLAEKLANELGVGVGDTVRLAEQDEMGNATDKTFDLTVTGVMENYIYNYVFIGPGEYARMEGGQPAFSTYYAVTSSDAGERAQFNDAVRAIDGVKTVAYNDEVIDAYKSMLKSVGLIVIVLVVAAAALAFIVLYNLTNINITERQREIATLKVLGFTPREVSAYIYRETMLLSVIGCAVGLRARRFHGGLRGGDGGSGPGDVRPHHPCGELRDSVSAHHAVHRAGDAGHEAQARAGRHGGEPEVQRVILPGAPWGGACCSGSPGSHERPAGAFGSCGTRIKRRPEALSASATRLTFGR